MKKLTKLLLSIFTIILLITYSFYFIKNQKKVNAERFTAIEEELVTKIESEEKSSDKQQQLIKLKQEQQEILAFVPLNQDKKIIKTIETEVLNFAKKIEPTDSAPLKIVLTYSSEPIQKNLTHYHYDYQVYRWNQNKKKWQQEKKKKAQSTLLNELSQEPFTLGDLFTNQQNLLLLTRDIQDQLLLKSKDPKKESQAIIDLPTLLDNQTTFKYEKDKVTITYPEKKNYIDAYTVDYAKVGPYLNPDFVDKNYLAANDNEEQVSTEKMVALTFDDGPNNVTTPQILKILKKKKVPATFFMLGSQVEKYPDIVKDIHEQGHVLANHSFDHPDLTTLETADVTNQINRTQLAIFQATGVLPKYVRPPYGNFDYPTAVTIGLPIVNWSVDSFDWKSQDVKKIKNEINQQIKPQSIILMHDIYQETADSLEDVITKLEKDGYRFVTVTELLGNQTKPLNAYYHGNDQRPIIKR